MELCKYCGNELKGDLFCSKCGAESPSIRNNTIREIERLIEYFKEKHLDFVSLNINEVKLEKLNMRKHQGFLGFTIIWEIFLIVFFLLFNTSLVEIFTTFLPSYIFLSTPGIISAIIFWILDNRNKKKVAKIEEENAKYREGLEEHYLNCKNCTIGREFANVLRLEELYEIVISGRASTIEKAINCWVEDRRHEEMQYMMNQTLSKADEALQRARSAEIKAGEAQSIADRAEKTALYNRWQ